jgi:hypothetical protein
MDLLPASERVEIFQQVGLTVVPAALKMHRLLDALLDCFNREAHTSKSEAWHFSSRAWASGHSFTAMIQGSSEFRRERPPFSTMPVWRCGTLRVAPLSAPASL